MLLVLLLLLCTAECYSPGYNDSCYETQFDVDCGVTYQPRTSLVQCSYLPIEFLKCKPPEDLAGNTSQREQQGYGCVKYGGQKYADVEFSSASCTVLDDIECFGKRTFRRDGFPCIKYSGHYFLTSLLYSVLLGF